MSPHHFLWEHLPDDIQGQAASLSRAKERALRLPSDRLEVMLLLAASHHLNDPAGAMQHAIAEREKELARSDALLREQRDNATGSASSRP